MSRRKDWTITFKAGAVAEAAVRKNDHHRDRLRYWEDRVIAAEKELKERGIEIDDSRADYQSTSNALQPRFDSALWQAYRDCHEKQKHHQDLVDRYGAWVRALGLASDRDQSFELDVEDVEYFGL